MIPRAVRYLVLAIAMVFATGTVSADSRSDARAHYQAGVKAYNSGDYRSAVREFAEAQQLAPADLNNYNLALCYDKLGDAEPAIQYYRAYLDKQPSTDKRAEIEASISRLEAAARSVATKKAEEARRAEEMRRAEEARAAEVRAAEDARRAAEDARRVEDARRAEDARAAEARAAEDARRAEAARRPGGPAPVGPGVGPDTGPAPMPDNGAAVGVGSTGTPGSGAPVSSGDAQLDRVQQIDVGTVRDQRMGGAGGVRDSRSPYPGAGPRVASAEPPPAADMPPAVDDKPKATPVYKKWWFWAVVGVSAYVVISIAREDSAKDSAQPGTTRGRELPLGPQPASQAGGLTLMRW
jgi:hypothetical protein